MPGTAATISVRKASRGSFENAKNTQRKNGITILRSYIDRALSAKTDNRPEFQSMVQDSAKGLFDTVLVWKLDRLARNRYDSAHYKAVSGKRRQGGIRHGKYLLWAGGYYSGIHAGRNGGILFGGTGTENQPGLTENALKGRNNGGEIPLGYQLTEDQHLRINPLTAPVVREIYQRYAEGENSSQHYHFSGMNGIP